MESNTFLVAEQEDPRAKHKPREDKEAPHPAAHSASVCVRVSVRVRVCTPNCPGTHYINQAALKPKILLPLPPRAFYNKTEIRDYRKNTPASSVSPVSSQQSPEFV